MKRWLWCIPAGLLATVLIWTPLRAVDITFLEILPDIDQVRIGATGKPTEVQRGLSQGLSFPIWNSGANVNEQVFFSIVVPPQWAGESNLEVDLAIWLGTANTDNKFQFELAWQNVRQDGDVVPTTSTITTLESDTGTAVQFATFNQTLTIVWDVDSDRLLAIEDHISFRLRRIAASADEISGEAVVFHIGVHVERGDLDTFLTAEDIADFITEGQVEELADVLATQVVSLNLIIQLAATALLVGLAFWRRHFFLFIIAGVASMIFGVQFADTYLAIGVTIAVVGIFMLYRSLMIVLSGRS